MTCTDGRDKKFIQNYNEKETQRKRSPEGPLEYRTPRIIMKYIPYS
jgi:hypothetical protein